MAVRTKEEIMQAVRAKIGDSTEDSDLGFVEDISDTLNSYEINAQNDWKKKYEDNDKAWRQKYRERFFSGGKADEPDTDPDPDPEPKKYRYEDLFKEES